MSENSFSSEEEESIVEILHQDYPIRLALVCDALNKVLLEESIMDCKQFYRITLFFSDSQLQSVEYFALLMDVLRFYL